MKEGERLSATSLSRCETGPLDGAGHVLLVLEMMMT